MIIFRNAILHSPPYESVTCDVLLEGEKICKVGKAESVQGSEIHYGKVLLPGYIDSHIHLLEYGLSLIFLDLRSAKTSAEVFDRLTSRLNEAKTYGFLYAFNLAPERMKETDWEPSSDELDKISTDLPIFVRREDGHSVYLNRAARRWLLYDQPIEKANHPLSGRFNELAVERMQERIPPEVREQALKTAGSDLISKGVTSASVMVGNSNNLDDVDILRGLSGKTGIDAYLFPQNRDVQKICDLELTRLGGCILIDGSFGSRTAALREPYGDAPGNMGILYFSSRELQNLVGCANEAGLQMTFHAIGDEAVDQLIRAYEKVIDKNNPLRHRIEHAELLLPDLIDRASKLNLIFSVQPYFEVKWGQDGGMYSERLGARRRWTNPFFSILKAGLRIAAGSDAPITDPDPAEGIWAFLNHPIQEERITAVEALQAYTYEGAFALHMEEQIGSIREGLKADLLVFDNDPFITLDFRPKAVIKGGRLVSGSL